MKRKSIIQRFKYLMAIFIIVFSQILPVYQYNAEANPADSKWLTYKFDEFSSDTFDQWFAVNGAAEVPSGANFIRLTPTVPEQSGAVFNKHRACPKNNYSFSTAFSFQMRNPSPEGASDGLTFTIQTGTTSQWATGGSLGYHGIEPSFTVKYDTFQNGIYGDPSSNYIGLAVNGALNNDRADWYTDLDQYNTANGTYFVLSDGTLYYTWIDYDGLNQNIQVRLGTSPDRASANVILDVDDIDLDPIFDGESYHAGFTAATGYPNYENHDIHSWYFVNDYEPIETLNPQNDYKQAPSSLGLTTEPANDGEYNVTVTLLDPLGNPVPGASPDALTATAGELTGPNGEPVTELVADAAGKVHAVLKNADPSQDITVSATIGCDNVSETIPATGEPPTEPPTGSCPPPVALINGSFEEPPARMPGDTGSPGSEHAWQYFLEHEVPGWKTSASDKFIQIMKSEFIYNGMEINPPHGNQYAELNAEQVSALYQDVETTSGQTIYWRLAHRGLLGVDTMAVQIGSAYIPIEELPVIQEISTGNTEWVYYSGSYTVPAEQTTTRFAFNSVDAAGGNQRFGNLLDDIFLGTEPCVVAEKSVSPEGDVFEGNVLTYEVTVKNEGGDIAADVVFEDAIPVGTEYVPGSMKILNGPNSGDLTDEGDQDIGYFDGEKVIIQLGDLPNTTNLPDGITVQFKVKALSSHKGDSVANKATIGYKNLLTGEDATTESNEVTNDIIGREDIDACAKPVALINGSFEEPPYNPSLPSGPGYFTIDQSLFPGWQTTDSFGVLEIFNRSLMDQIAPGSPQDQQGLKNEVPHGQQMAELNSKEPAQLYQDVETTPGQTIYWRLAHKGRLGDDTMTVKIGSADVAPKDLPTIETITTGKDEWQYYSGTYTVPAGQTVTRFGFEAVSSAGGNTAAGNFLDDIFLGTEPCVVAEKSVSPGGEVFVGDELTYEVTIKNNGGDIAADTVFEDTIPEGTEYVPGSMKILNGPNSGDLTDGDDQDAGHFDGEKVIIRLGDLPNTTNLPDGITVQFKVKALSSHAGDSVANKATIDYKNLLTGEDATTESNEVTTPVEYKAPELEAEKSATLLEKADGNTDNEHPEVGDTLQYTIQARNTVEDSLIENLVITDVIPEGLEYVLGTLKVNGQAVTDVEDDDQGHYADGQVVGHFGDVTDTEWHTLEFQVIVGEGQASKDIENVAVVDGDNVDVPSEPREEVQIYPRYPALDSEKTAENADLTKDHFEVGDTVVYTIRARNTVSDSFLENLVITDRLPEGLTYVEGSLEVSHDGTGSYEDRTITADFGDVRDTEWRTVTFAAVIQSGYAGETLVNIAVVDGDNVDEPSQPQEEVKVEPKDPVLEAEKTAELLEKADANTDEDHPEVGDTLLYTIQARNTVEDSLIENLVITDNIPEGLEYVPGTLKVNGVAVTDEEDGDQGHYANGQVVGQFGNVTDTEWYTLAFHVTVGAGQASKDIENVAVVSGDNVDVPSEPREEVQIYPRFPTLESEKTATNLDESKDRFEAGDTVVYTIRARNTVSDSLARNLTITDTLPEGLTYVEGSLEVSHGGTGNYQDGTITAKFGDVTDTEWRTVTFEAVIQSGYVGETLVNIAVVDGDNIDEPSEPREEVQIYPRFPTLEAEKTATNLNETKDRFEAGDTVVYTIRARNTVSNSVIENLVITDKLPEGLTYVEGSLEVSHNGTGSYEEGTITAEFGDVTDTEWRTVTFEATIESGQEGETIRNVATVDGGNIVEPTSPAAEITIEPKEPTDPGDGTTPTDPGNDTDPTDPGDGTTPTDPGNDTDPTDPGDGTTPTDPGNDTDPTDSENGTTPTDPGNDTDPMDSENGSTPTDPGKDTDLTDTGLNTTPTDSGNGTTPTEPGHKLPNTATNLYNLAFIGMIMIVLGLLMRRKSKVF